MKFIFPKNYNFKAKLFGILDYSTLFFNLFWDTFVFCFLNLFITNINLKILLFIVLCLPILFFSILGLNHENICQVLFYLFKYLVKPKIYLFYKN